MITAVDAPPTWMLRPLPRPVAPLGNELVSSYVRRVAWANRLDPEEFRAYVADDGRKRAGIPLDRLAVLSGQPERRLRRALDGLERPGTSMSHDPCPGSLVRAACTPCMARRGIRATVTVRLAAPAVVCRRHLRWLGEDCAGDRQPKLNQHPEILSANQLHRRLTRRYGARRTRDALFDANEVCQAWGRRSTYQGPVQELLQRFHPGEIAVPSRAATVEAACYPQAVALARILLSPELRKLPFAPTTLDRFIDEVRRTVAPGFRWNPTCSYGHYDPLIELYLTEDRRRGNGEPPRSLIFATAERPMNPWLTNPDWQPHPPASAA